MMAEQKLQAIETFLQWDMRTVDNQLEILDQIWYVVMENRLKGENE